MDASSERAKAKHQPAVRGKNLRLAAKAHFVCLFISPSPGPPANTPNSSEEILYNENRFLNSARFTLKWEAFGEALGLYGMLGRGVHRNFLHSYPKVSLR